MLSSYIIYGLVITVELSYDIKVLVREIYESNCNGNSILHETSVFIHTHTHTHTHTHIYIYIYIYIYMYNIYIYIQL